MRIITSAEVAERLAQGVKLDSDALRQLRNHGDQGAVERLDRLDRDRDRILSGAELRRVFQEIDRLDRDGSGQTFIDRGPAGALYAALLCSRRSGDLQRGQELARTARQRAALMSTEYGLHGTPTSPHPQLSGNHRPGRTPLTWLAGHWKCNQFVGDALTAAGLSMPTHIMPGGGRHYVEAELLPRCRRHFRRLYAFSELRPGDVLVVDHPGRGAATAHTEVVVEVSADPRRLRTAGAHREAAYERDWSTLLDGTTLDSRRGRWERQDGAAIYLLRAIRPLQRQRTAPGLARER